MSENEVAEKNWHYVSNGDQVGPVDAEGMRALILTGKISHETKVWNGSGEWVEAEKTNLAEFFKTADALPPLLAEDVNNKFIWGVVGVPVVGSFLSFLAGLDLTGLCFLANVGLCFLDEKKLKSAGHKAPSSGWVLLIPVYLWKRANLLGQKKRYFWGWIAALLLSLFIDVANEQVQLEEFAKPVLNELLIEEFGDDVSRCMKVTIDEEIVADFYRATAILENGNSIEITIRETEDEVIVGISE